VKGLAYRALRLVALLETLSFAVLLVGSVLRRTTDLDPVPVLGAVHGGLYLALVVLVLDNLRRLGWAPWFTLVMLTVGSPGAHFAVAATTPRGVGAAAGGPERGSRRG
jgi:integral membrane protein